MAIQGHLGRAGFSGNSFNPDCAYALAVKQVFRRRENALPGAFHGAVIRSKHIQISIHGVDPLTRE
jgi:hypothetical protein